MDKQLIDKVISNINGVLLQFKNEELGNRLTQFNYLSLEKFILDELKKLTTDGDNCGGHGK